jgi:hypothetical protein
MTYTPYGTADDVAAKSSWTRNGHFYDYAPAVLADPNATPPVVGSPEVLATHPSLTNVNTWLEQISHAMDAALASFWFDIPVDQTAHSDVASMLTDMVTSLVADRCDSANSTGRFFSQKVVESGMSVMGIVTKDLQAWVEANQDGLVVMGLTQTKNVAKKTQIYIRYIGIPQLRRMLPLQNRTGN